MNVQQRLRSVRRSEIKTDLGTTTILELRTGFILFIFFYLLAQCNLYYNSVIIFQLNISARIPFLKVWIMSS